MLQFKGNLEVFKNNKGYFTAVLKSFSTDKKVNGRVFLDVELTKDLVKHFGNSTSVVLDVIEGYVNVRHVEANEMNFDKLVLSVKVASIKAKYPND